MSLAQLDRAVQFQASFISYLDVFHILGILALVVWPIALFLKTAPAAGRLTEFTPCLSASRRLALLSSSCAMLALSGCMMGPNFTAPTPAVPGSYTEDVTSKGGPMSPGDSVNPQWWNTFNDPDADRA